MDPISTPKVKHSLIQAKDYFKAFTAKSSEFIKEKLAKNHSYTKFWNETAVVYKAAKQTLDIPDSFKFSNLLKTKWGKRAINIGIGIAAYNLIGGIISKTLPNTPAIPKNYDRGYDNIRESITDYGSPLSLMKTTSHVLMPYKSTVRKAVITDVNSIMKNNFSLQASKNAIKHHQY